jgi:hypothetical protein
VNVCGSRNCWPWAEIRTSSLLGEGDDDTLVLGLTDELTLLLTDDEAESEIELETLDDGDDEMELETLTEGESEMLVLGLTELEGESEILLLTLSLGDELMLTLTEELALSLTLLDGDELSDVEPIDATNTGPIMGENRIVLTCVRNGTPVAPVVWYGSVLGDDDTEELALLLMLLEALDDGELDTDTEGLDDTDDETLLIISRTAKCTAARSSDVPWVNPTLRAPCPAADSRTVTNPTAPESTDCMPVAVELAPAVGSV